MTARIEIKKDGPLLIEGEFVFVKDGSSETAGWAKMAICRCGLSKSAPFCDGSHKIKEKSLPVVKSMTALLA